MCVCEQYCLELYHPKGQKIKACKMEGRGKVVQGKHQSYTLSAASEDECDNWVHAIRSEHVGVHVLTFTLSDGLWLHGHLY